MESTCKCGIGPPGSIKSWSELVSWLVKPTGRSKCRWEDDIRKDLKEIGINTINCVDSAQDRDYWKALVNAALNLRVT